MRFTRYQLRRGPREWTPRKVRPDAALLSRAMMNREQRMSPPPTGNQEQHEDASLQKHGLRVAGHRIQAWGVKVRADLNPGAPNVLYIKCGRSRLRVHVLVSHGSTAPAFEPAESAALETVARRVGVEAHRVHVHFSEAHRGHNYHYFGFDELYQHLTASPAWKVMLLRGTEPEALLKKRQGRPRDQISAKAIQVQTDTHLTLLVTLSVNGREFAPRRCISLPELMQSLVKDGDYALPTCSCGIPYCSGITRRVVVVHDRAHEAVIWQVREPKLRRTLVFDANAYRRGLLPALEEIAHILEFSPEPVELEPTWDASCFLEALAGITGQTNRSNSNKL